MAFAKPMVGKVFGRLTVLKRFGASDEAATWECRCSCGKLAVVSGRRLRSKTTFSCGCYRGDAHRTHGEANLSAEYRVWCAMKARCLNPNIKRCAVEFSLALPNNGHLPKNGASCPKIPRSQIYLNESSNNPPFDDSGDLPVSGLVGMLSECAREGVL